MDTTEQNNGQAKIYQLVTDRIIAALEKGVVPWRKPWANGDVAIPSNFKTRKEYRGVNVLMLMCSGYSSGYWLTFKQATELGGKVMAGEKGTPVVYWNFVEKKTDDPEKVKKIPFLKYYTVFNIAQCEGIKAEEVASEQVKPFRQIELAMQIVDGMPSLPRIVSGSRRAAYSSISDTIYMPDADAFDMEPGYYSTLFHELVHATGHKTRLNRDEVEDHVSFGSQSYSKEELVAEMGAAFLCAEAEISNEVIDNQASYIDGWLNRLKQDRKLLIQAAGKAQRAADYIMNRKYGTQ